MITDLPPVENIQLYKYQGGFFYLYIDNGDKVLEDLSAYNIIEFLIVDKDNNALPPTVSLANNKITKAAPIVLVNAYQPNDTEISINSLDAALLRGFTLQFGSKFITIAGDMFEDAPIMPDVLTIPVIPINQSIPVGSSAESGTLRIFMSQNDRQQVWERETYRLSAKKPISDTEVWVTGIVSLEKKGDNCNA